MAEIPRRAVIPEIHGQLGMYMTTETVKLGILGKFEMFGMQGKFGMFGMLVMLAMCGMFGMFGMLGMFEMLGMFGKPGMLEMFEMHAMVTGRRMCTRKKPAVMAETT